LHKNSLETEVLWGATCRITLNFLKLMFGFEVPADGSLPVLKGILDETYMRNGKRVEAALIIHLQIKIKS